MIVNLKSGKFEFTIHHLPFTIILPSLRYVVN